MKNSIVKQGESNPGKQKQTNDKSDASSTGTAAIRSVTSSGATPSFVAGQANLAIPTTSNIEEDLLLDERLKKAILEAKEKATLEVKQKGLTLCDILWQHLDVACSLLKDGKDNSEAVVLATKRQEGPFRGDALKAAIKIWELCVASFALGDQCFQNLHKQMDQATWQANLKVKNKCVKNVGLLQGSSAAIHIVVSNSDRGKVTSVEMTRTEAQRTFVADAGRWAVRVAPTPKFTDPVRNPPSDTDYSISSIAPSLGYK